MDTGRKPCVLAAGGLVERQTTEGTVTRVMQATEKKPEG